MPPPNLLKLPTTSGERMGVPSKVGLYRREFEHDACGVGLICRLDNKASHDIVTTALDILKRLEHRGASGADKNTGDGAGLMCALPDDFLRKAISEESSGKITLPPKGKYGVLMLFHPQKELVSPTGLEAHGALEHLRNFIERNGFSVIAIRRVPVEESVLGECARASLPCISQLILAPYISSEESSTAHPLERALYILRRRIEKSFPGMYPVSCSSKTVVYKGLLLARQIDAFYPDLTNPAFISPYAIVHQRFSTNTFPTWELAQPFRHIAHNGEINTINGNRRHQSNREPLLSHEAWRNNLPDVLPLMEEGLSDSSSFDRMVELLVASGRDITHSLMMMVPQAWGRNYHLGPDVRGFFDYHSAVMEPWDGPATLAFCDGTNVGALLDRNGLRPARYCLTSDNLFLLASETGVIDMEKHTVVRRGSLRPGEMILCDLAHGRLVLDHEIKYDLARRQPYRRWVKENRISVHGLFSDIHGTKVEEHLEERHKKFGYTKEDIDSLLLPMAETGSEPVGSMGHDAPLAVLSHKPQLLFNYFKQLFAQVTNPPIDPIREELTMSLTTYIGTLGNILREGPEFARNIRLPRPILTTEELKRLTHPGLSGLKSASFSLFFPADSDASGLRKRLDALNEEIKLALNDGIRIIVLSDKNISSEDSLIPSLLALGSVNTMLMTEGVRSEVSVILETGEAREVMHIALLLGYGATAVCPYLALETVTSFALNGKSSKEQHLLAENYIHALNKGLLKIMSKMGISTLRSYRSSQLFEAVGLDTSVVDDFFPHTPSRIGGATLESVVRDAHARRLSIENEIPLPFGGLYKYRKNEELHAWNPATLTTFRKAVREQDESSFATFSRTLLDLERQGLTLRGQLDFVSTTPLPLDAVESEDDILRRFVSGAMSLGSLSPEAHALIATAMNKLHASSNSGEGGEDADRERPNVEGLSQRSKIRQIASGRFGVTIDYLAHADELQIKMAQGAKPGEGGQLPGDKVTPLIAKLRHAQPGITLISPPPHHDIYSIEDLAQLIYDLRCSNETARISVKLASVTGVGTIAAGVAKAQTDTILISGYDGGTGAAPLSGTRHAGLPWELGLAEAHQTLSLNNLRSHVKLQVDGQLRTGRDVVIAALLGADEFGFGTSILVSLGCALIRKCHENTCPMGIATQDEKLRSQLSGTVEHIETYLRFVAREVRTLLASLGLRSLGEARGRTDLLEQIPLAESERLSTLNLGALLTSIPEEETPPTKPEPPIPFDKKHILPLLQLDLLPERPISLNFPIRNTDATVGTHLSGKLARLYRDRPLADDTLVLNFKGSAGQSFGAFLIQGVTLELVGDANDFVGKGLSGGHIVIRPQHPSDQDVLAGNAVGYGATSGKIYIQGHAGERFAVRNSGMTAVVESVGDHACEYMTGGRVVILGSTGVNFGAGMTGGRAYVYDPLHQLDARANLESIDIYPLSSRPKGEAELLDILNDYYEQTQCPRTASLLNDWRNARHSFVEVRPPSQ